MSEPKYEVGDKVRIRSWGAMEREFKMDIINESISLPINTFTPDMEKRATRDPITNEANNGLSNLRGTVAMARTNHPHSATAQFFINTQDNANLDYTDESSSRAWGYAVFGRVTEGMNVVDEIRFVETGSAPPYSDVPKVPVIIESVEIIDG